MHRGKGCSKYSEDEEMFEQQLKETEKPQHTTKARLAEAGLSRSGQIRVMMSFSTMR